MLTWSSHLAVGTVYSVHCTVCTMYINCCCCWCCWWCSGAAVWAPYLPSWPGGPGALQAGGWRRPGQRDPAQRLRDIQQNSMTFARFVYQKQWSEYIFIFNTFRKSTRLWVSHLKELLNKNYTKRVRKSLTNIPIMFQMISTLLC